MYLWLNSLNKSDIFLAVHWSSSLSLSLSRTHGDKARTVYPSEEEERKINSIIGKEIHHQERKSLTLPSLDFCSPDDLTPRPASAPQEEKTKKMMMA